MRQLHEFVKNTRVSAEEMRRIMDEPLQFGQPQDRRNCTVIRVSVDEIVSAFRQFRGHTLINEDCSFKAPKVRQRGHLMDFIGDPDLYRAVMFARQMIRNGTAAGTANYRAAKYYKVNVSEVAHHVGTVAANVKKLRCK